LQVQGKKAIEIKDADVAELVDARDLKCLATPERSHLFWKTRSRFRHQPAERSEIWKTLLEASDDMIGLKQAAIAGLGRRAASDLCVPKTQTRT
jgi:hypothetical protein